MFWQDFARALSQDLQGPYGVFTRFRDQWPSLRVLQDPYDVLTRLQSPLSGFTRSIWCFYKISWSMALSQDLHGSFGVLRAFYENKLVWKSRNEVLSVCSITLESQDDDSPSRRQWSNTWRRTSNNCPWAPEMWVETQWDCQEDGLQQKYGFWHREKVMSTSFHYFFSNVSDRNFKLGITC